MNVEPYVKVFIEKYERKQGGIAGDRSQPYEVIWSFDCPRQMYDNGNFKRRLLWIYARFTYYNPRYVFELSYCFYDKKSGLSMNHDSDLAKLISHKMILTRYLNKLEKYRKQFFPDLLTATFDETPECQKAMCKINDRMEVIKQLEEKLKINQPTG